MRDHWRELGFWRWWWRNRVPFAVKSLVALLLLAGVVVGGWFAAQGLPSAKASDSGAQTIVRTVERIVTTPGQGRCAAGLARTNRLRCEPPAPPRPSA